MRHHRFDLNLLVYLEVLLDEQSVSRAAQRLNVTQPAVSEALSRLREIYDDPILALVGRRMVPTELARSLHEPLRSALSQVRTVSGVRLEFDPARSSRRFRIMASDYVVDMLLDGLIPTLAAEAPAIEIEFRQLALESKGQIRRGDVDLLIAPREMIHDDLPCLPLWSDTVCCVVWTGNTLVGDKVRPEEFALMGHVSADLNAVPAAFKDQAPRRDQIVVPQLGMIPRALAGTQRIATLPRRHAEIYCRSHPLRLLDFPLPSHAITEYAQWNHFARADPGLLWLRQRIQALVGDKPGEPGVEPAELGPSQS